MNTRPTPETDTLVRTTLNPADWIHLARRLERERDEARQQRDRLAEALKEIFNVSSFDYDTMPEPTLKKYREVVLEMADEALQSLTQNAKP